MSRFVTLCHGPIFYHMASLSGRLLDWPVHYRPNRCHHLQREPLHLDPGGPASPVLEDVACGTLPPWRDIHGSLAGSHLKRAHSVL